MKTEQELFSKMADEVISKGSPKRMKARTLLSYFGYAKRSEENAQRITEGLAENQIYINPSIMKIGNNWELSLNDRISLSHKKEEDKTSVPVVLPEHWNDDGWFDGVHQKQLRNEREVETKFIIPLLYKLGYSENDRYDAMKFGAFHGSKPTTLETDFSLFDYDNPEIGNQVLLVVEAKKKVGLLQKRNLIKHKSKRKAMLSG
jgi:hypothetical protein